ncbi:cytochrome C oxidase subunit IV family protein [Flavobacteriaceae bacterium F08102]|nr:cytochrome C oxidase subunit IV family protein [Flavobacteriaceae bacterium F08102]
MAQTHGSHESNVGLIWKVFGLLSIVTIIEVAFGIVKPAYMHFTNFLGTSLLNWLFLILTLVKAYGIAWYFMHLKHEKAALRRAIVWTAVFLIAYLATLLLIEGGHLGEIFERYTSWS